MLGNVEGTVMNEQGGSTFDDVFEEELREIGKRRGEFEEDGRDVYDKALKNDLVGLALSGGGIRSATFNLGVLQFLAESKLLSGIDYLSTVSGGGYIGTWLSAWMQRETQDDVLEKLSTRSVKGSQHEEHRPIMFLRQYSNYLTPKVGMFSADSWTLGVTYFRNLLLNLAVFLPVLFLVLLLPLFFTGLLVRIMDVQAADEAIYFFFIFGVTVLLIALSAFSIGKNLAYRAAPGKEPPFYCSELSVIIMIVLPIFLSSVSLSLMVWLYEHIYGPDWREFVIILGVFYIGPLIIGWIFTEREGETDIKLILNCGVWMVISTIAWLGIIYGVWFLLDQFDRLFPPNIAYVVMLGPPLVCLAYIVTVTVHIGLFGREFPDEKREWWSRLGAWVLIFMLSWTALFSLVFLGGPVLLWTGRLGLSVFSIGWLATTAWGLWAGKSSEVSGSSGKRTELLAKVAPYVFIIGLLMFSSLVLSLVLMNISHQMDDYLSMVLNSEVSSAGIFMNHLYFLVLIKYSALKYVAAACLLIGALFVWRVDINHFSMHLLYRNRLIRCYLGASNSKRNSHKFTGFDPYDDMKLHEFEADGKGPYPIINATLNLVGGSELAWQKRKAASFIFSPLYCGYELIRDERSYDSERAPLDKVLRSAYQRTGDYAGEKRGSEGVGLGMAMAISGAAASPNMGFYSSKALTFLMTIFNIRLGWWCRNPLYRKQWSERKSPLSLYYFIREIFGATKYDTKYVYLSDGGHFDNLGIYEMVRRRCRVIIACDAGRDPDSKFSDLGNAINKVRVDLGFDIDMDLSPIREGGKHCALGKIKYRDSEGDEAPEGILIYIKPVVCDKVPVDVLSYGKEHDNFPNEPTSDQWFDESQFESYRMLGHHSMVHICGNGKLPGSLVDFQKAVKDYLG